MTITIWKKAEDLVASVTGQDRLNASITVMKYEEKYGERGILDLLGFKEWCLEHDKSKGYINANIGHDLNGIWDKFLCPRTSGYSKFLSA